MFIKPIFAQKRKQLKFHDRCQPLIGYFAIRAKITVSNSKSITKRFILADEAMTVVLAAGMKAIWPELKINLADQFTWNAFDPKQNEGVIDHILYRDGVGMRTVDGGIIELQRPLADHKPVWADLEIPSPTSNLEAKPVTQP